MLKIQPLQNVRFDCGIFDSDVDYPNKTQSKTRVVQYFEIELITSCTGSSRIDGHTQKLYPFMLLLAKPGQRRSSVFGFKCYYIHYYIDTSDKHYSLLMNCPNYFFIINHDRYIKLWEDLIYYVNVKNHDVSTDIVSAKLVELFYFMQEDLNPNRNYFSALPPSNNSVPQSIKYIEEHYNEKLDLDFLSKQVSYSPNHYQHIFKSIMNCTPREYILSVRLKAAKKLLNDPALRLIDIAYQCGFSSQAYFNFIFKKETGLTPLEYRKTYTVRYNN